MAPFCLLGQNDSNMTLFISHDTDGIINNTTAFVSSRWSKRDKNDFLSNFTLLALASASCDANGIINNSTVFIRSIQLHNVEENIFGHVMPLMLVARSRNAKSVINGTIPFVRLWWSKGDAIWPFGHIMQLFLTLTSCEVDDIVNAQLHLLAQDDQNEVQHDAWSCNILWTCLGIPGCQWHQTGPIVFLTSRKLKWDAAWFLSFMPLALALVSHDANSTINGTIAFLGLGQLKWSATWLYRSCDTTGIGSIWCHWHSCQNHRMQAALSMASLYSLGQKNQNEVTWLFGPFETMHYWHLDHVMPMVLSLEPFHSLGQDNWNAI